MSFVSIRLARPKAFAARLIDNERSKKILKKTKIVYMPSIGFGSKMLCLVQYGPSARFGTTTPVIKRQHFFNNCNQF